MWSIMRIAATSVLPEHPGETARSQLLPGFEVSVGYLFRGEQ